MNIKRVVAWLLLAFLIFFIVIQPETAASLVRGLFDIITDGISALAAFFRSLV